MGKVTSNYRMKRLTFIMSVFLCTSANAPAQYFAPLGATWISTHNYFGPGRDYNLLTVIDTSVFMNGKKCSKLSKLIHFCSPEYEYMFIMIAM